MYESINNVFGNQWSWSDFANNEITVAEWSVISFVGLSLIAIGIEIYMKIKKRQE